VTHSVRAEWSGDECNLSGRDRVWLRETVPLLLYGTRNIVPPTLPVEMLSHRPFSYMERWRTWMDKIRILRESTVYTDVMAWWEALLIKAMSAGVISTKKSTSKPDPPIGLRLSTLTLHPGSNLLTEIGVSWLQGTRTCTSARAHTRTSTPTSTA
jgi:hypothetical protein